MNANHDQLMDALLREGVEMNDYIGKVMDENSPFLAQTTKRPPGHWMSELCNPEQGPIANYWLQTAQIISAQLQANGSLVTPTLALFRNSSDALIANLSKLGRLISPFIDVDDYTTFEGHIQTLRFAEQSFFSEMTKNHPNLLKHLTEPLPVSIAMNHAKRILLDLQRIFKTAEDALTKDVSIKPQSGLGKLSDLIEYLGAILRTCRRNGALIRETLWFVSGKLPQYKPTDGRSIGLVKESMVQTAINRILSGEGNSPRAILNAILDQYAELPDAYHELIPFLRQVERELKKSKHNLKDMF